MQSKRTRHGWRPSAAERARLKPILAYRLDYHDGFLKELRSLVRIIARSIPKDPTTTLARRSVARIARMLRSAKELRRDDENLIGRLYSALEVLDVDGRVRATGWVLTGVALQPTNAAQRLAEWETLNRLPSKDLNAASELAQLTNVGKDSIIQKRNAANERHKRDPKQQAKTETKSYFERWVVSSTLYESKAAFARDMREKFDVLTSEKTIERWVGEWAQKRNLRFDQAKGWAHVGV